MSMDAKPKVTSSSSSKHRDEGIRIFTWPKMVYIFPSAIVALICAAGMWRLRDKTYDPTVVAPVVTTTTTDASGKPVTPPAPMTRLERFRSPQNLMGVLFLAVLAFNLLVMAIDFPRFELLGVVLLVLLVLFFLLWAGSYFQLDLMKPVHALLESIYVFANAGFYFMYFLVVLIMLIVVYATRWLDYWEVLPNEILHHHGPLSDLERFPTTNLKFDKEIPDVLEYALLRTGRLVLHIPNVERAIVLENVLFINSKEMALKSMMSRLDVHLTADQEVGRREI